MLKGGKISYIATFINIKIIKNKIKLEIVNNKKF